MSHDKFTVGRGPDPFAGESIYPQAWRDQLELWVAGAQPLLGLADWEVRISGGIPTDETSKAETFLRDSAREAIIAVGVMVAYPEIVQRATIIHELLHCVMRDLTRFARDAMEDEMGQSTERLFNMALNGLEERTVDALARGLAPLFQPLPAIGDEWVHAEHAHAEGEYHHEA